MIPPADFLRNFAIHSLERTRLARVFARRFAGLGSIFVMHRVVRPGDEELAPHHCVTTRFIEEVLDHVRRRGWDRLPLAEVPARLRSPARNRFVCFTFDDGYRDNLELGRPVLEAFDTPATIYACAAFAERTGRYWWGALAELVASRERLELPLGGADGTGGGEVDLAGPERKRTELRRLVRTVRARPELLPRIDALLARHGIRERELMEARFATFEDLARAARTPGLDVGSHTLSHRSLRALSEPEAREEIAGSKALLERRLGRAVGHLAYPFGAAADCGPREFALAREAGYATATTTRQGNLFREHAAHLTALPRIPINAAMRDLRHFELYETGTVSALQHGFARVVTE